MTKDEALKMAIEAMDTLMIEKGSIYQKALEACKEALEHQEVGDAEIKQMLNDIEYYQKRVEELEQPLTRDWKETIDERIAKDDEFKRALEQPSQEPVGWMDSEGRFRLDFKTEIVRSIAAVNKEIPLYTHPAPSWQGLSDDEIKIIQDNSWIIHSSEHKEFNTFKFARDIEQALKDKNT